MKYLLIIIIIICNVSDNFSEINRDSTNNSFGARLSNLTGYGIFYNRKINEDIHLQMNGLIYYYVKENSDSKRTNLNYSIGAEIQQNIFKSPQMRSYILAGAYYYFDDDETQSQLSFESTTNNSYNVGVGIALEYFFNRFVLSFELGYKIFEDNIEHKLSPTIYYPERERTSKIGGGLSVGFTF
jgi:hypothetical protein